MHSQNYFFVYSNVYSATEERTNTVLFFTLGTFYTFRRFYIIRTKKRVKTWGKEKSSFGCSFGQISDIAIPPSPAYLGLF